MWKNEMWPNFWLTTGLIHLLVVFRVDGDWNPCDARDVRIIAERPASLSGRWVSRRCEVRNGPQNLLRDYEFGFNTSFVLHQYYYSDNCRSPLYSLTIRGVLNEIKKSWMLPGAIDVDYTISRITVMPYTQDHADLLQTAVLRVCPLARFSSQSWPAFAQQEVFNYELYPTTPNVGSDTGVSRIDIEFDCLEALNFTFNELNLIRIQRRRWMTEQNVTANRKELYTGESPRTEQNDSIQRPVSYLPDFLVKAESEAFDCPVCQVIDSSDISSPPVLDDPDLRPPFPYSELTGQWYSLAECESRPSGSFIRRIITLDPESAEWRGEYQHYTEPDCQQRSFTILGSGTFILDDVDALTPSSQRINFLVLNATVSAHLDFVRLQLSAANSSDCGLRPWILDRPNDITPTGGCQLLGLTVPNADFNIFRLEYDTFNNSLLYLGQDYQDTAVLTISDPLGSATTLRPTSFQPALVQCGRDEPSPEQRTATTATSERKAPPLSPIQTRTSIGRKPVTRVPTSTIQSTNGGTALFFVGKRSSVDILLMMGVSIFITNK